MAGRSAIINVMVRACHRAGRGLLRDFGEVEQLQVSPRGPADFVSSANRAAEQMLVQDLRKARRDHGLLLEHGGEVAGRAADGRRFIVNPLDGATNFLHGVPHFAVSVALEERGEIIAGVVYEPTRDELFWAERGVGAYLNDRRLRVSGRRILREALLATGIPLHGAPDHDRLLAQLAAMMANSAGVRRLGAGSLDLAYVAAGRFDGYWETGLHPWDCAAGILLVGEAGGYVSDLDGGGAMLRTGDVVVANDHLHGRLLKLLRDATLPPT